MAIKESELYSFIWQSCDEMRGDGVKRMKTKWEPATSLSVAIGSTSS